MSRTPTPTLYRLVSGPFQRALTIDGRSAFTYAEALALIDADVCMEPLPPVELAPAHDDHDEADPLLFPSDCGCPSYSTCDQCRTPAERAWFSARADRLDREARR